MPQRIFTITFECENEDWLPDETDLDYAMDRVDQANEWTIEESGPIQQYERQIKLLKLEIEDLKKTKTIKKNYGDINIS